MGNDVMRPGSSVYVCDFRHPCYRIEGTIDSLTHDGKVVVALAIGVNLDFDPHEIELDRREASPRLTVA